MEAPMVRKARRTSREALALVGGALLAGALSEVAAHAVAWIVTHFNS